LLPKYLPIASTQSPVFVVNTATTLLLCLVMAPGPAEVVTPCMEWVLFLMCKEEKLLTLKCKEKCAKSVVERATLM